MGWGRMPRQLVDTEIKNGDLMVLNFKDFSPFTVETKMVRRHKKRVGPVAAKLWLLAQGLDHTESPGEPMSPLRRPERADGQA